MPLKTKNGLLGLNHYIFQLITLIMPLELLNRLVGGRAVGFHVNPVDLPLV